MKKQPDAQQKWILNMLPGKIFRIIPIALIFFFTILTGISSADYTCPNDDLDKDIMWVKEGTTDSIKWGKTTNISVDGIKYIIKVYDFDSKDNPTKASVSIANMKTGDKKNEILTLDSSFKKYFEWNNEIKVQLKDIKTDSDKTPYATFEYYSPGKPSLEIDIQASSEKVDDIKISETEYVPEEEKKITITVKNNGDSWIDNLKVYFDTKELELKNDEHFDQEKGAYYERLDWLAVDDEASFNFTVQAPTWDQQSSPYANDYSIESSVSGYDIFSEEYTKKENLTLQCSTKYIEPDLRVVQKLNSRLGNDDDHKVEINTSSWFMNEKNTGDIWEYVVLERGIYNIGNYPVSDLKVSLSDIPEELVVTENDSQGDPYNIADSDACIKSYKLMPLRYGTYNVGKMVVTMDFFGEKFEWKSSKDCQIIVHGPDIRLDKTLVALEDAKGYEVQLEIENKGDRAAWANVSDTVPAGYGYVEGSLEDSIEGSDLPLSEWEYEIKATNNNSTSFYVQGVRLPPEEPLKLTYRLSPGKTIEELPFAQVEFHARNNYRGKVRSAFYLSEKKVDQWWNHAEKRWENNTDKVINTEDGKPPEEEAKNDTYSDITSSLSNTSMPNVTAQTEAIESTTECSVDFIASL
jgi:hypothetical protein